MPVFLVSFSIFIVLCFLSLPGLPNPGHSSIPLTIGGYTIAGLFSAALIGVFVTHSQENLVRRFFQNPILVMMGRYSYSMYLFHIPVALILLDVFWHSEMRGWKPYILYIITTYILTWIIAVFTWNFLEKHMLSLKKYFDNNDISSNK
jgi:peptidoglycan/LPS O-acetylase OafA/YrhL